MSGGRLTIVGTGIRAGLHTSIESRACIEHAQKVLYLVSDPVAAKWVENLNTTAESLSHLYETGRDRLETYDAIIESILRWLRDGVDLCVVFYGHPGFLVSPSHEAIRQARLEGFQAEMLAGISCFDLIHTDLGLDLAGMGYQAFEATTFLVYGFRFDTSAPLILYQISVIGDNTWSPNPDLSRLSVLIEYLHHHYGSEHEVIVYEACPYAVGSPLILRMPLSQLIKAHITHGSTLYVPPKPARTPDAGMLKRLGLEAE
jgi:hypothetical protein